MPDDKREERKELEEKILKEAPRLGRDDEFRFACHPGVVCFGDCCGDVNIVLTPYDVLRLKNRLGLTSAEFLDEYTILPFTKDQRIPAPLLKMRENEKKQCPFLTDEGCSVYEDRPWACRMYPLGYASPGAGNPEGSEFWFLLEEEVCKGFDEDRVQTVRDWIRGQGMEDYDEMGELYKQLAVKDYLETDKELDPRQMQMFFLGTYDLDRFRRFVFESTFLDRFDVPADEVERLKSDDGALMRFAFRFLRFSLFGKPTMKLKAKPDLESGK